MHTTAPATFLSYLRERSAPFVLARRPWVEGSDAAAHRTEFERDPELYALLATAPGIGADQRAQALFQLLRGSRDGFDPAVRRLLDEVTSRLMAALDPDAVIAVFLALRRARANHKHVTRAILGYVLEGPDAVALAYRRRAAVVDCLEHAIGKSTMRACARMLGEGPLDAAYVRAALLKFVADEIAAMRLVRVLYGYVPAESLGPIAPNDDARAALAARLDGVRAEQKTVTTTNRGEIAAALFHAYRGGATSDLLAAAERRANLLSARLPRFGGTVALVLDVSASTRGYGEREWACVSQSVAFRMVLERCCERLFVFQVGGEGELPEPSGATDLAGATLDAVAAAPDLVVVVTDGYENAALGDLARVAEALARIGERVPVALYHSMFSAADDLTLRRPAPALPGFGFWHEDDFETVLLSLFALAEGERGREAVRAALAARLDRLGEEVREWSASNSAA